MQHQEVDLKPYMDEILTLADGAIEAVIWGKIVKDGKVKAGDYKAIDMLHHQIELELASTWQKASAKRALEVRLSRLQTSKEMIEVNMDHFDNLDDRLQTDESELIDPKSADPKLYRGWA